MAICKKGSQDFNVKAPKRGTQVIELIKKHRVEKLSQLLQHGKLDPSLELKWVVHGIKEYVNALHVAASRPSPDVLQLLLQQGCPVDQLTGSGQTALHMVASHQGSNPDNIDMLVENGIDVNAVDKYGRTALHEAVLRQHLRVVRKLAQLQNIELYKRDINGKTALDLACESNNVELQRWADQFQERFQLAPTNPVHDRHDLTHAEQGELSEITSGAETVGEENRLPGKQNNQLTQQVQQLNQQIQQQNQQLQQQGQQISNLLHEVSNLTYMLHSKLGVDYMHHSTSHSKKQTQSEPIFGKDAQRHPAPSRSLDLDNTESASGLKQCSTLPLPTARSKNSYRAHAARHTRKANFTNSETP